MERQLRVYVVDDNTDSADSLAALVGMLGHQASACYSAAELLALVGQTPPDCVLLDIAMTGMDGLELARLLRQQFGDDVILVAVTGAPERNPVVEKTFEIVDHYFVKPVDTVQLKRLLSGD